MGNNLTFNKPDKYYVLSTNEERSIGVLKLTDKQLRELSYTTMRGLVEKCLSDYFEMEVNVGIFTPHKNGFEVVCGALFGIDIVDTTITLVEVPYYETVNKI